MMLLALLLQVSTGDVVVNGPGKPNAQTPATMVVEPAAMFIAACDADRDGRTTRAELTPCIALSFAAIDIAKAGKLRYLAFAEWSLRWLGDQTALPSPYEVDRDGDDAVTLDELQAQFARLFSRYDKDGDGAVTRAEALTVRAVAADGKGPIGKGPKGGGKKGERPAPQRVP